MPTRTITLQQNPIYVPPPLTGDLNNDGIVNVLDIVLMIEMTLDEIETDFETADLNGDGIVNVQDIVILINMILPD